MKIRLSVTLIIMQLAVALVAFLNFAFGKPPVQHSHYSEILTPLAAAAAYAWIWVLELRLDQLRGD